MEGGKAQVKGYKKKMKNFASHSLTETENLAKQWLDSLNAGDKNNLNQGGAIVVALNGQLGSGKTTFVQFVAKLLGVQGNITSPTFVVMKNYPLDVKKGDRKGGQFRKLVHIDAYRLEKGNDLAALEFEDIVADPGNLVLIEWAENVKEGLSKNIKKIDFEYINEKERKISF